MNYKKFIHFDSAGSSWGIVSAEQVWSNVYALKYNKPEKRLDQNIWQNLFTQAKDAAHSFNAESIEIRIRLDYEPATIQSILNELGFKKKSGRIEYQCDVKNLPDEKSAPLVWKTARDLGWDHQQIADFTKEIIKDSLDINPNEKPEDFIQDWLHHEELTSGLDCIAIGFIEGNACALTVVQVNKDTGWSRIAYMGVIPSYRGKGLGKWVHQHGFAMMKQQGGILYHGGTHSDNLAMRKLFETHGCAVYCEMEEWSWRKET